MTERKIKISWQLATSMNTLQCKICRLHNVTDSPYFKHGFAMELCQQFETYPIHKIPYWQNRIRGLIRKHYKEYHPIYKVK